MANVDDFGDLMQQTVTWKALVSRDAYGAAEYGSGTSVTARVSFVNRNVKRADGSLTHVTAIAWLKGSQAVSVEDQITLPDGTTPPIVGVDRPPDESGSVHHTRVMFG